jgi:SAM-dependent methyltransferase
MAWYEELFTQDYDRVYFPTFTPERNRLEADFIQTALQLPVGARILDLACGHGRHALEMALRGFQVTGLDLNSRFIEMGRKATQAMNLQNVEFVLGDMREFSLGRPFAAAYCYFTSFGYFSDEENLKVLQQVAAALSSSGKFLLETTNRDSSIHKVEHQPRRWDEPEPGLLILEDDRFNARTSRIHTRAIILDQGLRRMVEYDIKLYTHTELEDMFEQVGMKIVATYGNKDFSPYSVASPRMAIVAEKIS